MNSKQRIRKALNKYVKFRQMMEGVIGRDDGVVSVPNRPGYVYVRVPGRGNLQVYNAKVAPILDLPVFVGYNTEERDVLQVISVRASIQAQNSPTYSKNYAPAHHRQHEWTGTAEDIVFSDLRQIMPMRVTPVGGFELVFYRGIGRMSGEWMGLSGQSIDVSTFVPITGARYVLVSMEQDGLLSSEGGTLKDIFSLSLQDIPDPRVNSIPLAAVRVYGGQTGIYETKVNTDVVDLRWPGDFYQFEQLRLSGTLSVYSPMVISPGGGSNGQVLTFMSGTWSPETPSTSSGSGHTIQDEGTPLTQRANLNFVGQTVWATDDPGNNATIISISGSSGAGGGHVIEDEGTPLTQRSKLDFRGSNVWATDDAGNDATIISISGSSSSPGGGSGTSLIMYTEEPTSPADGDNWIWKQVITGASFLGTPIGLLLALTHDIVSSDSYRYYLTVYDVGSKKRVELT